MVNLEQKVSNSKWELPFQAVLHIVIFLFYSVNGQSHQETPQIDSYEVAFFLNYALAAFVINYYFFPKFLYKKKYWQFFIAMIGLIITTILIEELVLEKIYFSEYRGKYFGKIIYSLLDVLPVTIILSGFKLAWDIIHKQIQVEELKATIEESELRFLKSQINPHFLFNNLNNLYAHALENSPKTPEIILEMSAVLRYMLYECRKEYVTLSSEVAQLENFIRLYEMQIEGRGEVYFAKAGSDSTLAIAPLILMVFVENAFKHSASNQSEDIRINIRLELRGEQLYFECTNSFEEAPENTLNDANGIGLENVRKRLSYIYPNAHELTIDPSGNEYSVKLTLTLTPQQ